MCVIKGQKIKDNGTSISKIFKSLTFIFPNLNNFHSLGVVDRVSENEFM